MITNTKTLISELTPATLEKNGIAYAPRTLASLVYMNDGSKVSDTLETIISDGKRFNLKTKTEFLYAKFNSQRIYEIPVPIVNYDFDKFPLIVSINNTIVDSINYELNDTQLILSEEFAANIRKDDTLMFIFHYLDIIVEDRGVNAEFINNVRFFVDKNEPRHKQTTDVWFDTVLNQVKQFNGQDWDIIVSGTNSKGLTVFKSTINVDSKTPTVELGVRDYNSRRDLLFVYLNSIYLEEGYHYTVDEEQKLIRKVNGNWDGREDTQIFNFIVFKNIPQALGTHDKSSAVFKSNITITSETDSIDINIEGYNSETDTLFVYVNSTYLEEGQDYIVQDNRTIHNTIGNWDGTKEPQTFNFVVFKNIHQQTEQLFVTRNNENNHIAQLVNIIKDCQSTISLLQQKVEFLENKITKE